MVFNLSFIISSRGSIFPVGSAVALAWFIISPRGSIFPVVSAVALEWFIISPRSSIFTVVSAVAWFIRYMCILFYPSLQFLHNVIIL